MPNLNDFITKSQEDYRKLPQWEGITISEFLNQKLTELAKTFAAEVKLEEVDIKNLLNKLGVQSYEYVLKTEVLELANDKITKFLGE